MLTAPTIVIAYTRHRCNARVAAQAGDEMLAVTHLSAAAQAASSMAGTEWRLIDAVAAVLARDTALIDPTTALARAGLNVPEGV